jgi:PncC family amidohydrolase
MEGTEVSDIPNWDELSIENMIEDFIKKGVKIRTAESCTGGGIVNAITNIDGSSKIIDFSMVAYSPEVKEKILDVSPKWTTDENIVSQEVAEAMNKGLQSFCKENRLGDSPYMFYITITGWIGTSPVKDSNVAFFTIGYTIGAHKTFKIFINQGNNKEEKKQMIIKRILGEVSNFLYT